MMKIEKSYYNALTLFYKKNYMIATIVTVVAALAFAFPAAAIADSGVDDGESVPPGDAPAAESPQTTGEDDNGIALEALEYQAQAKANGRSHITVKWSAVDDAEGYIVYRSSRPDKPGKKIFACDKASARSYKDTTAEINEKYWYDVEAWGKAGGKKETLAVMETEKVKNALRYKSSFEVKAYAYTGGGTTASGKKAQVGRVAVDPNVIELGTWLYIEDYGLCEAADTGGSIKGNKVDLYMDSLSECYDWGVRDKMIYILE
jgi:3D (Asp-Asp-Asp) domain-containing protein